MGPHPVIPDHTLGQGAGVLVTVLAVMLVLTNLNVHIVKSTQTCDEQTRIVFCPIEPDKK